MSFILWVIYGVFALVVVFLLLFLVGPVIFPPQGRADLPNPYTVNKRTSSNRKSP